MSSNYELVKECQTYFDKIHDIKYDYVLHRLLDVVPLVCDFSKTVELINNNFDLYGLRSYEDVFPFEYVTVTSEADSTFVNIVVFANNIGVTADGDLISISDNNTNDMLIDTDYEKNLLALDDDKLLDLNKSITAFESYMTHVTDGLQNAIKRLNAFCNMIQSSDDPFCVNMLSAADVVSMDVIHLEEDCDEEDVLELPDEDDEIISENESLDDEFEDDSIYDKIWEDDYLENIGSDNDDENEDDEQISDKVSFIVSMDCIPNYKKDKFREYQEIGFNVDDNGNACRVTFMINSRSCKLVSDTEVLVSVDAKSHYKVYKSNGKTLSLTGVELEKYYKSFKK